MAQKSPKAVALHRLHSHGSLKFLKAVLASDTLRGLIGRRHSKIRFYWQGEMDDLSPLQPVFTLSADLGMVMGFPCGGADPTHLAYDLFRFA
jgi:hypothetical protein